MWYVSLSSLDVVFLTDAATVMKCSVAIIFLTIYWKPAAIQQILNDFDGFGRRRDVLEQMYKSVVLEVEYAFIDRVFLVQ